MWKVWSSSGDTLKSVVPRLRSHMWDSFPETPVEIVRPPQDTFQPPGSDIVFEVELNKDRVEVKWMRNNMIIVQGDKYQMISEGKVHRLQVCEIRPRDQGEYKIVAKDKDARAKLELAGRSGPNSLTPESQAHSGIKIENTLLPFCSLKLFLR